MSNVENGPPRMSPPSSLVPPEPITNLFLIRHGEVESRYHRVFGGRIDMELSPTGHQQAEALARHLQARHLDAIYASPMKRAQQTLAPLIAQRQCAAVTVPDLHEVDFGDWTGLDFPQVLERFNARAYQWLDYMERAAVPNGECARTLRARLEPCVRQMLHDHAGRDVAVVCHGGVIRVILAFLLDLPLPKMAGFEIDYASITWVEIKPHKTEVQLLNFTPWRRVP